jgi:hypothetical protein
MLKGLQKQCMSLGLYILDSIKGEVLKKELAYNQADAFVSPFGPRP